MVDADFHGCVAHHLLSSKIIPETFEIQLVDVSLLTSLTCCAIIHPFREQILAQTDKQIANIIFSLHIIVVKN